MEKDKETCFVIMPNSAPKGYQETHFDKIYQYILSPAIEQAGFEPYRADEGCSSDGIPTHILEKLMFSPMAICDLSAHNPNVLYELGIRHMFKLPVALVQEMNTPRIFDISNIRTYSYDQDRHAENIQRDVENISRAIQDTYADQSYSSTVSQFSRVEKYVRELSLKSKYFIESQSANVYQLERAIHTIRGDLIALEGVPFAFHACKDAYVVRIKEIYNLISQNTGIVETDKKNLRMQLEGCEFILQQQ